MVKVDGKIVVPTVVALDVHVEYPLAQGVVLPD